MVEAERQDDGGAAYPQNNDAARAAFVKAHHELIADGQWFRYLSGMSLRDYFAGQALAGVRWTPKKTSKATTLKDLDVWTALIARACYLTADAMLAARKQ